MKSTFVNCNRFSFVFNVRAKSDETTRRIWGITLEVDSKQISTTVQAKQCALIEQYYVDTVRQHF